MKTNENYDLLAGAVIFILGAGYLCVMYTVQNLLIGTSVVAKGYVIPFCFGGIAALVIHGKWRNAIQLVQLKRKKNIFPDSPEAILPICSHCKKIRKPNSDYRQMNSWEPLELYLTSKTSSRLSHGICPNCMNKHYGEIISGNNQ